MKKEQEDKIKEILDKAYCPVIEDIEIINADLAHQIADLYKPPEKVLLSDEEIKEELKKYYTEEQMTMPEYYFDIASGAIAVVRKAQAQKCQLYYENKIREILDKLDRRLVGLLTAKWR